MTNHPRHLILLLANTTANLGDRVLEDVLERSLCARGRLLILGAPESPARRKGEISFGKFLSSHLELLTVSFQGRLRKDRQATLVLPPGESVTKAPSDVFRVAGQLAYLSVLRALGVRVVSLGHDCESLAGVSRFQERGVSSLASYYSLRDRNAVGRARAIGIRSALWFPDLSWLSRGPQSESLRAFAERSTAVLCFRAGTQPCGWDQALATSLLDRIGGMLDEAAEAGLKDFVLVRHADDDNDRRMTASIFERYGARYSLRLEPEALSIVDIPRVYGNAALVISNRLHAILIGFQWGAVGLALIRVGDHDKVFRHLIDMGLEDHVADVDAANPCPGVVQHVLNRQATASAAVAAYRARAVASATKTLESLFG